jgi:hypothetical protein
MIWNEQNITCQIGFWLLVLGMGLVASTACASYGTLGWTGAIVLGFFATGVSGLMLGWVICQPLKSIFLQAAGIAELDDQAAASPITELVNEDVEPACPSVYEQSNSSVVLVGDNELAAHKGDRKYDPSFISEISATAASQEGSIRLGGPINETGVDLKKIKGFDLKAEKLAILWSFITFVRLLLGHGKMWTGMIRTWSNSKFKCCYTNGWIRQRDLRR